MWFWLSFIPECIREGRGPPLGISSDQRERDRWGGGGWNVAHVQMKRGGEGVGVYVPQRDSGASAVPC